MEWILVGLGNPGDEYEGTRHNVGRTFVRSFVDSEGIGEWKKDTTLVAEIAKGTLFGKRVRAVLPNTFMNLSGKSIRPLITSAKSAERLIVVYDDMDLPLGRVKVSFGRSSGGHNGLESIIKSLKTKDFVRVRVGVGTTTPGGKLKKPSGEAAVVKFLLGKVGKSDAVILKKTYETVARAITIIVTESREKAMSTIQ